MLEELRRVPLWLYLALLVIGSAFVARTLYQGKVAAEAAAANNRTFEETRSPIAGMNYTITVDEWSKGRPLPLHLNGPLTTADSFSVEAVPISSDCSTSRIKGVEMEFLSTALVIDPPGAQSRSVQELQRSFCSDGHPANYHWDILPKQEGRHLAILRIAGLDARGNRVGEAATIEIPIVVSDSPFTLASSIALVSALGGLLGALLAVSDRFTKRAT